MTDLFPKLFATTKAIPYFVTTLAGFKDSENRFKFFDGDESPTTETIVISVDISPGGQDQRTSWHSPIVTFNIIGKDTDDEVTKLWAIANALNDFYSSNSQFSDGTAYTLIGQAEFGQGRNPVTEHRVVSVALQFGLV